LAGSRGEGKGRKVRIVGDNGKAKVARGEVAA
jgi:hypothetical protein